MCVAELAEHIRAGLFQADQALPDAVGLPDPYYGVAIRDQPVIAIDKVRYVGDMVAAVAAVDEETAYRALTLIEVRYDPLPAVTTIDEALAEGAPLLFDTPAAGEPIKLDPCHDRGDTREPFGAFGIPPNKCLHIGRTIEPDRKTRMSA